MKSRGKTAEKSRRGTLKGDIEQILGAPEGIHQRVRRFAARLSSFLDGAAVSVFLYEKELGDLLLKGSSLRFRGGSGETRHSAAGTLPFLAIVERRGFSLAEREHPPEGARHAEYHVFPLEGREDVTGAVTIERVAERPLEGGKLVLAKEAVRLLAVKIDEMRQEEITSHRLTSASAINEAGVTFISAEKLDDLLQRITAMTLLIMGAEGVLIRLFDEEAGKYTLRDCHGLQEGKDREKLLQLERQAVLEVLESGRPLLVRDTSSSGKYAPFRTGASSFLCHPIGGEEKILGTLTLVNKTTGNTFQPPCFTKEDVDNLGRLMKYVERALANAMAREKSRALDERDEETGLPNAKGFTTRLQAELSRARRFESKVVVVACRLRVGAGGPEPPSNGRISQLLKSAAETIRASLRDYDVVARIGPYRFGMILPQAEDAGGGAIPRISSSLEKLMERLRAKGDEMPLDVGFAQAVFPDDGEEAAALIEIIHKGSAEPGPEKGPVVDSPPAKDVRVADILRSKQLFFGLRDDQLLKIAGLSEERPFKAGDAVFREGDPGDSFYLLEDGEIDIYKTKEDGRKVKLSSLKPGAVFGEMTLVIREPRSATAIAGRDSLTVCLPHLGLTQLFHEDREVMLLITMNMTRILARRLRQADISFSERYASP